jgi:hypothetical protein
MQMYGHITGHVITDRELAALAMAAAVARICPGFHQFDGNATLLIREGSNK